jgi:hypothetical protein
VGMLISAMLRNAEDVTVNPAGQLLVATSIRWLAVRHVIRMTDISPYTLSLQPLGAVIRRTCSGHLGHKALCLRCRPAAWAMSSVRSIWFSARL